MDALFHTWELGQKGWGSFQRMLLVADSVTIWSPSHDQIADAHANHGLEYTPEELLELIRNDLVRVGTRKEWLSGSAHREELAGKGFRFTPWHPQFDGTIKKMVGGSVTVLDKPDVQSWVRQQREQETKCFQEAVRIYEANAYDRRWLEVAKIKNGILNEGIVVNQALDTARHHYLALKELGLNVGVEPWSAPSFFDLVGRDTSEHLNAHVKGEIPTGFTFENLMFEMNKTRYLRGDKRDFSKHLDALLNFRDKGLNKLFQVGSEEIPSEKQIVRDLKRKVQAVLAKHERDNSWENYPVQCTPILMSGCATLLAAYTAEQFSRPVSKRGLLKNMLRGMLSVAAVTAAVEGGDQTVSKVRKAFDDSTPSIKLDGYQQALYLMVNGEYRTTLQTNLAEVFMAEIESAASLLSAP